MFHLELERVIKEIKDKKAEQVLIQLPDGLKPQAQEIVNKLEHETGALVFIWLQSCYGACDIPQNMQALKIDLVVQFGHNMYHKSAGTW